MLNVSLLWPQWSFSRSFLVLNRIFVDFVNWKEKKIAKKMFIYILLHSNIWLKIIHFQACD